MQLFDTIFLIYFVFQFVAVIHFTLYLRKASKVFYRKHLKGRRFFIFRNKAAVPGAQE